MAFKDYLRGFLKKIEASDKLVRVKKEVDPDQEISAANIKAGAAALLCEKVKGYDIPVVANLFADRRKIELALALQTKNPIEEYLKRLEKLKPPKLVRDGPVKENIITGNKVDIPGTLPIPVVNENDGGRYISSGIIVAKDPMIGSSFWKASRRELQFACDRPRQAVFPGF